MLSAIIPVDSVEIPLELVELCAGWYHGSDDTLYAIASTHGLTRGNCRPAGCHTPQQWYVQLWREFSADIGYAVRSAERSNHPDYKALANWEEWADRVVALLELAYDLTEWERE